MSVSNREIYNNALVHIGEAASSIGVSDYEERAPYLIAAFCSTVKSIDKQIRKSEGLGSQGDFSPVSLPLDSDFPLCDRLSAPAALYVASILVIDEDPELSDSLYDKYCDNIASIAAQSEASVPSGTGSGGSDEGGDTSATCEPIIDRYFFD